MKEIIAKRDRRVWIFDIILLFVVAATSEDFIKKFINTDMHWVFVAFVCCGMASFLIILWSIFFLPDGAIVKDGEQLILYNGMQKKTVLISQIICAEIPNAKKSNLMNDYLGLIVLRVNTEKGEKKINVPYLKDPELAVENVNQLLHTAE